MIPKNPYTYGGPDQSREDCEPEMKKCDYCKRDYMEFRMKYYRSASMCICPDCKEEFERLEEENQVLYGKN